MTEDNLLPLEHLYGDAVTILTAALPLAHPGHASRIRAITGLLGDCLTELQGPRVRYRRFALGVATEVITGRLIGALGTDNTVVILGENDGHYYERSTGAGGELFSWSLERLDGVEA